MEGENMMLFKDVPVESDTTVTAQREIMVGKYQALYQKWLWDGIVAESIIFIDQDAQVFTDQELFTMVKEYAKPGSKYTIQRSCSGFTFVNFNFHY